MCLAQLEKCQQAGCTPPRPEKRAMRVNRAPRYENKELDNVEQCLEAKQAESDEVEGVDYGSERHVSQTIKN
jgi:hypothetical protein